MGAGSGFGRRLRNIRIFTATRLTKQPKPGCDSPAASFSRNWKQRNQRFGANDNKPNYSAKAVPDASADGTAGCFAYDTARSSAYGPAGCSAVDAADSRACVA